MRLTRYTMRLLMTALAALGYRGWLVRPWRVTIGGYAILVASCAAALVISRFPSPMIVFVPAVAVSLLVCFRLPRHGFRLADVTTLLAIILLTSGLLLPEIERTRDRTAGRRYFPHVIPARFIALVRGLDYAPPF
jgi:hypothetical protein